MGHLPPSQKGNMSVCTWMVTQEPPKEKHGKGELAGLHPPKTGLPSPWHGSASSIELKVCLHPVYTHSASKPPKARLLKAGEVSPPSATALGRAQWGLGHQGRQLAVPHRLPARGVAQSRDTVPTQIHQDPSGHGPRAINPCPSAHGLDGQQGRAQLHPRPSPGCSQIWDRSSRQRVY